MSQGVSSRPVEASEHPIFVAGSRRSGTTMLRLMLACHPRIAVPPEGGFVVRLGWRYERSRFTPARIERFVGDLFAHERTVDWNLDREALTRRLLELRPCTWPAVIDAIYREYIRLHMPDKPRWGDKTTWYEDHLEQIDRYFPSARYVHILRDGRAVAASYRHVAHLPKAIEPATLAWAWSMNRIARFGEQVGERRYIRVRYESLVAEPERELRRICAFLEEEYAPEMLDFGRQNRERSLEPKRHIAWKNLTTGEITTAQVDRWRQDLSAVDLDRFWAIGGDTMRRFGYEWSEADLPVAELLRLGAVSVRHHATRAVRAQLRPYRERLRQATAPRGP